MKYVKSQGNSQWRELTMETKMTIIITMAGMGSRFRKAGYNCPKYMIEAKGKTLFEWSMDSLIAYNPYVSKYIFIVRKEDNARGFIKEKFTQYGIGCIEILEIDQLTDGQATTCILALPFCDMNKPILIYNIDTYVEPYAMRYEDISGDGHIPCFHAEGDHWSFVKLNCEGKAVEVREKMRISDNCTLGAYYFSSAALYEEIYKKYYIENHNNENNERYIAPLYNYMISQNMPVTISNVDAEKVHVLGTPEELKVFMYGEK